MLEYALSYAQRGLRVLPIHGFVGGRCTCGDPECGSPAKHPRTRNGNDDATTDEEQIRRWWARWPDSNIGIQTGVFSNLVVLDVDDREGLRAIESQGFEIPETLKVSTGRGWHFYFKHPMLDLKRTIGALKHVDVIPDKGFVVAPPSIHSSGRVYEFEDDEAEIAPMPDWMRELAQKQTNRTGNSLKVGGSIEQGGRNDTLFRLACRWRINGFDADELFVMLQGVNAKRCKPPLDDDELLNIARSAAKYEADEVGAIQVPEWQIEATVKSLQGAGVGEGVVDKVKSEIRKSAEERASAASVSAISLRLTRRTAGLGFGGVFDVEIAYAGRLLPLSGVSARNLKSYESIHTMALAEGILLPEGKNAKKHWRECLMNALTTSQVVEVERDPEEEPVTACIELAREWLSQAQETRDVEEIARTSARKYMVLEDGAVAFNGRSLWSFIAVNAHDAKRHHIAEALRRVGVEKYFYATLEDGKRAKLRRAEYDAVASSQFKSTV